MKSTTRTRALSTLGALALLLAGAAGADTFNVDRFDDSTASQCSDYVGNDCSLRGAVIRANSNPGDDVVRLQAGIYTLSIPGANENGGQTGDLDVLDTLIIEGTGPERTVVDAAGIDRVLHMLAAGERLTVRGVTITGGYVFNEAGAGVSAPSGSLRLDTCAVSGNEVQVGLGGAAVNSISTASGDLTEILDSWITGNTAGTDAESIVTVGTARIDGSTVSGNTAWGHPVVDVLGVGSLLINSTFEKRGEWTGEIAVSISGALTLIDDCTLIGEGATFRATQSATTYLRNTLVVGRCTSGSPLTSLGGNLESPGNTCGLGASDLVNVPDAMLSDLGWFGGPTPTHRPLPGSPAVDAPIAAPGCPALDQRGLSRPRDGDGNGNAVCDIGAVELAGDGEIFVEAFECGFTTPWSGVTP